MVMATLRPGNSKLGYRQDLWAWSLPALLTCPGRTDLCSKLCYADDHFYRTPDVRTSLERNWAFSQEENFPHWMVEQIHRREMAVLRIHVAGDFHSVRYTRSWWEIISRCSETTFYFYTRSWRIPELRRELEWLAALDNVHSWWSCDLESDRPQHKPRKVRLTYLLSAGEEKPPFRTHLIFRDSRHQPGKVLKRLDGVLVCPTEQGLESSITCSKCRICFDRRRQKALDRQVSHYRHLFVSSREEPLARRIALPLYDDPTRRGE